MNTSNNLKTQQKANRDSESSTWSLTHDGDWVRLESATNLLGGV